MATSLEPDTQCELCDDRYSVAFELTCLTCEGPLCPFCAVQVQARRYRCPSDCGAQLGECP